MISTSVREAIFGALVALLVFVPNTSSANESLSDRYFQASTPQLAFAAKRKDGTWQTIRTPVVLGMERLPGNGQPGFNKFAVVVDLSKAAGSVPAGCATKLSIPWSSLAAKFPPDGGGAGFVGAPTVEVDGERAQTFAWQQSGCIVSYTTWSPVWETGRRGTQSAKYMQANYPGLPEQDWQRSHRIVRLNLKAGAEEKRIQLLVWHHEVQLK